MAYDPTKFIQWSAGRGGLKSDLDARVIQNGHLYTTTPYTGAQNVRSTGKGTGVSPFYEPISGNAYVDELTEVTVQKKVFRIYLDNSEISVTSAISFEIHSPSGLNYGFTSFFFTSPFPNITSMLGTLKSNIDSDYAALTITSVVTVTGANTGYVEFSFDTPLYEDFQMFNFEVSTGDLIASYEVTQEAVDPSMLGEWKFIGSAHQTGDTFMFFTTRVGTGVSVDITDVQDDGGGLIQVTTATDHGYVDNQTVLISEVIASPDFTTPVNNSWQVTVIDATNFTLQLSDSTGGTYTSGGISTTNLTGLGEIGVVFQDSVSTDDYIGLLRSREFNFSTTYQIDARSQQKQDSRIGVYFCDGDNNPMRVFYYKGAFLTNGAIQAVNADGQYAYDFIADELVLLENAAGLKIRFTGQIDAGGALKAGNKRYAVRGLTEALVPSEWSMLTETVSVFSATIAGTQVILGDAANQVTPKINVLEITNSSPGVYQFCEIAVVEYVGIAIQGYIIGRYTLDGNATQVINHTGNEQGVVDLDVGELNRINPPVQSARNVEILANTLLFSNLTPAQFSDFTAWVETFEYAINTISLDPIGVWTTTYALLQVGEFQLPSNIYDFKSHMMYEQYRYGFRFRLKNGLLTPVFYPGYDIRFDLDLTQPGRNAGTWVSFDLDNGSASAPTEVYSLYIDWQNIDLDFIIDGRPARELISGIIACRAEVIPEVLAHGGVVMGVENESQITGPTDTILFGNPAVGAPFAIGPFPYVSGCSTYSTPNPTYPQATPGGVLEFDDVRTSAFFYSPDLSFSQTSWEYRSGDQLISFGNGFRHNLQQATPANTVHEYNYAEFTGYSDITANPTPIDIDDGLMFELNNGIDPAPFGFPPNVNVNAAPHNIVMDHDATGIPQYPYQYDRCFVCGLNSALNNTGVNSDYGFYRAIYFRPQANKYGDPKDTIYTEFSVEYEIGDQDGIIPNGSVLSYGDCFTQKTYLKFRYPGWYDREQGSQNDGFGMGFGYYAQNRANIQLRRKPTQTYPATSVIQGLNLEGWLTFGYATPGSAGVNDYYINFRDTQFFYNKGYTPRNGVTSAEAFDSTFNYQVDWGNAIMWSNSDANGSNTDYMRIFSPFDIVWLDYSNGPIEFMFSINEELVTGQHRVVLRQYFDNTEAFSSNATSEILLGSGGKLRRRGTPLTKYGCQHKWSAHLGKSDKGFDTLYFLDWTNKTIIRYGYNGADSIDEINGMKSFFANSLDYLWQKDNPASGMGVTSVADQRYREILFTFRSWKEDIEEWTDITDFNAGDVTQYGTVEFEEFPAFFIALVDNAGIVPTDDPDTWQQIPITNTEYYNVYTIVFNELKNEFQAFHTPRPLLYAPYKNGYLTTKPISNTGEIWKANAGDWTWWYDAQAADAFFDATINHPPGRKRFKNVSVEADVAPTMLRIFTPTGESYTPTGQFQQREGNEFVAPIMMDSSATGLSDGDTSIMYGDYGIHRWIIAQRTYNKIGTFVSKMYLRAREVFA